MHVHFRDAEVVDQRLVAWLRTLDEHALTTILANRPDALEPPWPRRLDDLARRLDSDVSTVLALRQVPLPALQLVGAVQLCADLGGGAAPDLAAVCDQLDASEDEVRRVLVRLGELALLWVEEGRLQLPDAMQGNLYARYQLGPPLTGVLQTAPAANLKLLAGRLDVASTGRKQQLADRLLAFFRDRNKVRELVGNAPKAVRELLLDAAWHGPVVDADLSYLFFGNRYRLRDEQESTEEWAVNRGLVYPDYDGDGVLPLEVGLALRGPAYRLPFTPEPPAVTTARVSEDEVSSECSAAALRLVDRTLTTLRAAETDPIPLLKSGRVGVRTVRAIAKNAGATADEIRLVVELAVATALLAPAEPPTAPPTRGRKGRARSRKPESTPEPEGLVPTELAAAWRAADPAVRLRSLVSAWWTLAQSPLAEKKAVRAVLGNDPSAAFADVRLLTVRLLSEQAEGIGTTDGLVDLVGWHAPMLTAELTGPLVDAAVAEADLLGVTASGSVGELGRALTEGSGAADDPALVKAADTVVAGARTSALFGSDLTAIVTGPADAELAGLLDRVATRESQGSASSWRFSPDSVRRAFDNGARADELLDQLGSVAEGTLPQPLVYLVNDVARRHGELGVLDVRCAVVAESPALLTEIAANRRLADLGLRQLAPTVLTSRSPATETLDALRKAGYAPVAKDGDGTVAVTSARPSAPTVTPSTEPVRQAPEPAQHAARLLRESSSSARPVGRGDLMNELYREQGKRLAPAWMSVAWQLEAGLAVRVDYRELDGETSQLLISSPELDGDVLDVWSAQDGDYRRLELSRITPVDLR